MYILMWGQAFLVKSTAFDFEREGLSFCARRVPYLREAGSVIARGGFRKTEYMYHISKPKISGYMVTNPFSTCGRVTLIVMSTWCVCYVGK